MKGKVIISKLAINLCHHCAGDITIQSIGSGFKLTSSIVGEESVVIMIDTRSKLRLVEIEIGIPVERIGGKGIKINFCEHLESPLSITSL
jgi:hypothetical protein